MLDDTHNASAASFRAAIEWAHNHSGEPKVLITPGLIELGEEHDRTHTELGALSARVFDRVIFTQKHGRKSFMQGFGKDVELLKKNAQTVPEKALLVCVGRISASTINQLLA